MPKTRKAEYKPLSFSTTMRNPERIVDFLNCILPYEGQVLNNTVIEQVATNLIRNKLYCPVYINRTPRLKSILESDDCFEISDVKEIMENSPQDHKELDLKKVGLQDLILGISYLWSLALFTMKWTSLLKFQQRDIC